MTAMHTYNGYKLTVRESQTPPVAVFDSRYPRAPALYKTTSLDKAMRWVDAYIKGEAWANDVAVGQARNEAMGSDPRGYDTVLGATRRSVGKGEG